MVYWGNFVTIFFITLDIQCYMECHLLRPKEKMPIKLMIELRNVVINLIIQIFQIKRKV
jgi:hypothetical protein